MIVLIHHTPCIYIKEGENVSLKASLKSLKAKAYSVYTDLDEHIEQTMLIAGVNDRAAVTPDTILGLVIVVIVAAAALPAAITAFFSANTSGWTDPATIALWGLIPLIIIAVIVIKFWKGN